MKSIEFMTRLLAELDDLASADKEQLEQYYNEFVCDGIEQGLTEEEIVEGFGVPEDAARLIREEYAQYGKLESSLPVPIPSHSSKNYKAVNPIRTIIVEAENLRINVCSVKSGPIRVLFEPREGIDRVSFSEENGQFLFRHTTSHFLGLNWMNWKNLFRGAWMLTLEVPTDFVGDLTVRTSNAAINASGLTRLHHSEFITNNAKVTLGNIHCASMFVKTSNGRIDLTRLSGQSLNAETSNGRVTTFSCAFPEQLTLETRNGIIEARNLIGDNILMKSSNGAISGSIIGDMRDYAIDSHTSNGSNNLPNYSYPNQSKHLMAKTSNGLINVTFVH